MRVVTLLAALLPSSLLAADIDAKYPLGPQLKVLAEDVKSPSYRKLVTEKMLITDLAAEWQRYETEDNADSFLKKYGGKEKVLADAELKQAYERRLQIRNDFLELMREGYRRYKKPAPFDQGEKAEPAGTQTRKAEGRSTAIATSLPSPQADKHWPRFRGPSGQGLTGLKRLPTHWSKDGTNLVWRTKLTGKGNSSPVIWGDRVFLTSADEKGNERYVHCYSAATGRLLWTRQAPSKPPEAGVRDKNGYASATPVTDGERVIVFLGSCGLLCYDMEGKLLWHHDAFQFRTTHGTASSPLLYKDLVILVQDQNQQDSVFVALDKRTGELRWKGSRPRAMGWATPVIIRVGEHDELIIAGGETVRGYDPETGKELWNLKGPTTEVVPTIVVGRDLLYSASGRSGPTLGLKPGGKGDVTETHLVWRTVRGGPHVPSPILVGNQLYTVNDFGIATCLDAETGELIYQGRIPDKFSASPIEAGGLLYFCGESGVTYLVRVSDKFEVVGQNDLGAPILASPAVIGDHLIIRTDEELVRITPGTGEVGSK